MTETNLSIKEVILAISNNFSHLTDECVSDLLEVAKIRLAGKNEIIFQQDDFVDRTFYFIQGCVKAYRDNGNRQIIDWFSFENEFITPITGFFRETPSEHSIETLEPCVYLELSRDVIFQFVEKHHCFETLVRKGITDTLLKLQDRIASIQFESASHKYNTLLKTRPDIIKRVSLTDIANYLGISLETLSRVRAGKL